MTNPIVVACCLCMVDLIDKGFRIKSALNILVNQFEYPGKYDECCKDNDIDSEDEVDNYLLREKPPLVKPRRKVSVELLCR